jgi:hypothetical protein
VEIYLVVEMVDLEDHIQSPDHQSLMLVVAPPLYILVLGPIHLG